MAPRVLVAALGAPYTGEGTTCAYTLFRALRDDRPDVAYLTLLDERDQAWTELTCGPRYANPEALPGVHHTIVGRQQPPQQLAQTLRALRADVIVAVGDEVAARLAPVRGSARVVFYACERLQRPGGQYGAPLRLDRLQRRHAAGCRREQLPALWSESVLLDADLILAPSKIGLALLQERFPFAIGKTHPQPVWCAPWIVRDAARWKDMRRPFDERDIDLLLVSNRWKPQRKGYGIAQRLVGRFRDRRVVVVGEPDRPFAGAEIAGLISDRSTYMDLLGRARVLACPDLFQLSSTPLFEAAAMGANLVASRGCGNWSVCHPDLVVDRPTAGDFERRISIALESHYESALQTFTGEDSYLRLLEILDVV